MKAKLFSVFFTVFIITPSEAAQANLSLEDVTIISYGVGAQSYRRILFNLDGTLPENARIDHAEIRITDLNIQGSDENIRIEFYPVTLSWDPATVSWTFPWDSAGGDYDSDELVLLKIPGQYSGDLVVDISRIVRDWYKGERENYGLLVKRPYFEGGAFLLEGMSFGNALTSAEIVVYYSREN